jgi:hypothetical protein
MLFLQWEVFLVSLTLDSERWRKMKQKPVDWIVSVVFVPLPLLLV